LFQGNQGSERGYQRKASFQEEEISQEAVLGDAFPKGKVNLLYTII